MRTAVSRSVIAPLGLAALAALAGCGKVSRESTSAGGGPVRRLAPVAAQGAVSLTTRNTTRLGGQDSAADAAGVARAVYPGLTPETRPRAVVLVNARDWPAALAASVLASAPTSAPLLYSDGEAISALTRETLLALHPTGLSTLGGAQVISIGTAAPLPAGLTVRHVPSSEPAATAAAVAAALLSAVGGTPPREVIVVASDAARAMQMPAASLAAESGAPIAYVTAAGVPAATATLLASLGRPSMYVVDPAHVSPRAISELRRYGRVVPIADSSREGVGPTTNSIALARFIDNGFGWGVKEPGHGLVFANAARPLDAPAAAPLSATGDYGPLLLLERANQVPPALATYLGDIQPAYTQAPQFRPVRGVYNHGWLIGDEQAITAVTQAELDSLLEISPRRTSPEETAGAPPE
jgi:hypothetical protein